MALQTIVLENVEITFDARTLQQWTAETTIIPSGFPCVEINTDRTIKFKLGDGARRYSELPYIGDVDLSNYVQQEDMDSAIEEAITQAFAEKGTLFKLKGTKESVSQLPPDGNEVGDVYLVSLADSDEMAEYYWTGTKWDFMGTTTKVDLSEYYKKSEVYSRTETDELLEDKIGKGDTLVLHCKLHATED